ncbi:hypothetical protein OBBRIDRAFT_788559 [Obba rivulosa]|uniref:F-box domain-containing protein n=1 Tax=Obba rivulosa TaxID=1052685 RepID=A0A8E2DSN2_9APHY|nr:hypothetical protein OBBRIDRAFT_788559 [Obba rivulosa]
MSLFVLSPLPPEVTDRIIDYLWADRASLRSCALTCRAWLPASRYHLFHTLRIWSREAFDSLTHKSCIPATAELFRFVQHLSIRERSGPAFAHLVPPLLVSNLPKVTSMDIHKFSPEAIAPEPSFYTVLGRFSQVTTLELHEVSFGPIHDTSMFLCSFPSLTHLTLHKCVIRRGPFIIAQQAPPVRTLSLTSLAIGEMMLWVLSDLLQWLSVTPTAQTLKVFVFRGGKPVDPGGHNLAPAYARIVTRFIHNLGASLQAVTVPLLSGIDEHRALLVTSRGLRKIHLRFNANNHTMASRYLSHVPSTQVQTVELQFGTMSAQIPFDMYIPGRAPIPSPLKKFRDIRPSLQSINDVLISNAFPVLEQVIVRSSHAAFPGLSQQAFRRKIQQAMRGLDARGMLQFSVVEDEDCLQ